MLPSVFNGLNRAPPIEVFNLMEKYKQDSFPQKVDLSVGAYRTDDALPWILPVVNIVENQMTNDNTLNKEYLPVLGLKSFVSGAIRLLLGDDHPLIINNCVDGVQSIGGTGALYLGMIFLRKLLGKSTIYVSAPTWPNHKSIASLTGFQKIFEYRYWDSSKLTVDFDGMCEDLSKAENGSIILLHACSHNPTGMDITQSQWKDLSQLMKERNLFPFFDLAYQGFASGDLEADAWPVRYFALQNFEMLVAQSFSKNFGLYNERVGNLAIISLNSEALACAMSQITLLVRQTYSNPPQHGARIVATVLNNPDLYNQWRESFKTMSSRIKTMRESLYQKLRELGTPGPWDHIIKQIGMFSFTGLNRNQVEFLISKYHIYLMSDGRINMCGLTTKNVDYVAKAVHDAVLTIK